MLSLGYTGAYFNAACVASQIDALKQLSTEAVCSLLNAYRTRISNHQLPLIRQVPFSAPVSISILSRLIEYSSSVVARHTSVVH